MPGILRCAAQQDLWPEALDLLGNLTPERLGPIADVLATLGDEVIGGLVDAVCAADLWGALLPVVRRASPESCAVLAAAPAFHTERVLGAIVDAAATTDGLWVDLVPLVEQLPDAARTLVARLAAGLEPSQLRSVVDQALAAPATVTSLVRLYLLMDPAGRDAVREAAARGRRTTELDAALDGAGES